MIKPARVKYLVHIAAIGAIALASAACSRGPLVGELPLVYRPPIQQGNVITPEMLAQLRPGMDQRQVRFIMGTPAVADTFHSDRWDYLYTMDEKGEDPVRRRVTLVFADGLLQRVEGDVRPAIGALQFDPRAQDKTVDVPPGRRQGFFARVWNRITGKGQEQVVTQPGTVVEDPTDPIVPTTP